MRAFIVMATLVTPALVAATEDRDRAARAALEVERGRIAASRARKAPAHAAPPCHDSYDAALEEAKSSARAAVFWVGVRCTDRPELREALSDCVHCHLDDWGGDQGPYLVIRTAAGDWYRVRDFKESSVREVVPRKTRAPAASPPAPSPYFVVAPPAPFFTQASPWQNCRTG